MATKQSRLVEFGTTAAVELAMRRGLLPSALQLFRVPDADALTAALDAVFRKRLKLPARDPVFPSPPDHIFESDDETQPTSPFSSPQSKRLRTKPADGNGNQRWRSDVASVLFSSSSASLTPNESPEETSHESLFADSDEGSTCSPLKFPSLHLEEQSQPTEEEHWAEEPSVAWDNSFEVPKESQTSPVGPFEEASLDAPTTVEEPTPSFAGESRGNDFESSEETLLFFDSPMKSDAAGKIPWSDSDDGESQETLPPPGDEDQVVPDLWG